MNNMSLFLAGLILIVFAGMFHVYRYAMSKTKEISPPPTGKKLQMTKSISFSDSKELPSPDSVVVGSEVKSSSKPENGESHAQQLAKPEVSEVNAGTSDLEMNKDQNIGMSDLKKS
jgi:ubiquinol-cytochrome c reductase cytochrome b subunit